MLRRALTTAAILLATCLVPASAEAKTLKSIWGPNTLPDGRSAFPMYHDLGVDVIQWQLSWARTARWRPLNPQDPNDPAYKWPAATDIAINEAKLYKGMRVSLMVKETPPWANSGGPRTQAPDNPGDYADFLIAVSRRYPTVRHWMIWGEPQRPENWTPLPANSPQAPRAYAMLLERAYWALKLENKRNIVIGGMTFAWGVYLWPTQWVRWMRLPNGRPPRMDWWGHNAFVVRKPDLSQKPYEPRLRDYSDLDTFRREIRKAYRGRRTPPFWVSEFGVSSDRSNRIFPFFVSREEQAKWIRAAYRIADRKSWIKGVGWYKLLDEPDSNGMTTGLLDANGLAKPAYYAYKRAR
jgi:hypothetical protein